MADSSEIKKMPMVQWFNPKLLVKLGWQVIVSAIFGQYADQRTMQAALDDVSSDVHVKRADLTNPHKKGEKRVLNPDKDGAIWIDYIADLGEGFNSTYSMATLVAQDELKIGGKILPRGEVLIMGGDEVYPTSSPEDYKERMRIPYKNAFPDCNDDKQKRPRLFAIPGNHDWYDGLTAFSRLFLRHRDQEPKYDGFWLGNWRCKQSRSYFALKLTEDCWLWGLDIQLKGYVDQPQVDYFRLMAKELPDHARVILCTAQPSWLKAETPRDLEYKSLNYIARIVDEAPGFQEAVLLIAGDIHHYSRYSAANSHMQFITAGGGGAFLHPTHQLKPEIEAHWRGDDITLKLANNTHDKSKLSCYPDKETSKSLLWGNFKFILRNWDFCIALGCIFGILANLLVIGGLNVIPSEASSFSYEFFSQIPSILHDAFNTTTSVIIGILVVVIMYAYADTANKTLKAIIGPLHGILHLAILFFFTVTFQKLNIDLLPLVEGIGISVTQFGSNFALFIEIAITTFLLSGGLWGLYLMFACRFFNMHTNDGFSAMQIADYKNFLRIKIQKEKITVYPIGLNKIPNTDDWQDNPDCADKPTAPTLRPKMPLKPHLIEAPIVLKTSDIKRHAKK